MRLTALAASIHAVRISPQDATVDEASAWPIVEARTTPFPDRVESRPKEVTDTSARQEALFNEASSKAIEGYNHQRVLPRSRRTHEVASRTRFGA